MSRGDEQSTRPNRRRRSAQRTQRPRPCASRSRVPSNKAPWPFACYACYCMIWFDLRWRFSPAPPLVPTTHLRLRDREVLSPTSLLELLLRLQRGSSTQKSPPHPSSSRSPFKSVQVFVCSAGISGSLCRSSISSSHAEIASPKVS